MISKILGTTKDKPCSCPLGIICKGCKSKKVIKPQIFIEEPRHLPIPIAISHYREKPIKIQSLQNLRKWKLTHHKEPSNDTFKLNKIGGWFKQNKTLKELETHNRNEKKEKHEHVKREKASEKEADILQQLRQKLENKEKQEKLERERARREEAELVKQLEYIEKQEKLERDKLRKDEERLKIISLAPPKTETEKKKVKVKSANARPRSESRYVSVKTNNRYDSISYRFVNCCYRFCCQIYCCLTLIILVGLFIFIV